jgi:predicted nucleic acid-binding protein
MSLSSCAAAAADCMSAREIYDTQQQKTEKQKRASGYLSIYLSIYISIYLSISILNEYVYIYRERERKRERAAVRAADERARCSPYWLD